jgi:hypothetical protein
VTASSNLDLVRVLLDAGPCKRFPRPRLLHVVAVRSASSREVNSITTSTSLESVVERVKRCPVTLPALRASMRSSNTAFHDSNSRTRWRSERTNTGLL